MGYHRAGFEVVGVDIAPQPHYPFEFHQADALEYCVEHGREFDVIHASPPCQAYSVLRFITKKDYPDYIPQTRIVLQNAGKPWIIENVIGAPLQSTVMLCGAWFGLKVYRHRLFETSWFMFQPEHQPHKDKTPGAGRGLSPKGFMSVSGNGGACHGAYNGASFIASARLAMGMIG